jgi:opacity protein-like surface antigen
VNYDHTYEDFMKLRLIPAVLALGLAASMAHASTSLTPGDIYLQGGTQGIGIGYAQPLTSWLGVRADINGGGLSHDFTAGDLTYDAHLHLFGVGTYVDLFPFKQSGFRVSTGLLFNDNNINGTATPDASGNITINGTTYNVPNASVSAKLKEPSVMPYLGIGYGHSPAAKRGFGFTADLGVAFGRPHVDFNASPDVIAAAGAENVAAEEQNVRNKADKYHIYPIVQIGVTYRF